MILDLLHSDGVQKILELINNIIGIIRWIVPIGLIFMTSIDIFNKVINTNEKEGQKKIINRLIAAILVFLTPLIVNLVMKLVEIGGGEGSGKINNNTSKIDNKIEDEYLDILYCPQENIAVGSNLSLTALINENYNGKLTWTANYNDDIITLIESNNEKKLNYVINSYPNSGMITISLKSDHKEVKCNIYVEKPKEEKVHIINCPTPDKVFDKGDKFNLNANGSNIEWEMYVANEYLNIMKKDNGVAEIEVLDFYPAGNVTVIARNNLSYEMCKINIRNKEKTSGDIIINNCPKNKVKIGDTFTLSSNEVVNWNYAGNTIYSNYYQIISSNDKEAIVKIIGHYNDYLPVTLTVKNNLGNVGYCIFYTYNE